MANPQSTAKIAGHPIHPMLIPFPIAFFVGTFACDIAYWITGNANWAMVTPWLLGAGIIMAALAALAGLTDVVGEERIRSLADAWWHAGGNVTRGGNLVSPGSVPAGRFIGWQRSSPR